MGGSEQARRPLLVADQEDAPYHQSSNGGVDGNSSATGFLVFSTIVAATCSFTSGYCVRTLSLSLSQFLSFFKILSHGYLLKIMFVGAWGAFRDFDSKYNNFSFANLSEENSGFMEMQVPTIFVSFSSGYCCILINIRKNGLLSSY